MEALILELQSILGCKVEVAKSIKTKEIQGQCTVVSESGMALKIHRQLTEIETLFIKRWMDNLKQTEKNTEINILLKPDGHEQFSGQLRFPLRLWRILYKENQESVDEILKSTFIGDMILNMNSQETVAFVSEEYLNPNELLGTLESDALTSARIVVGNPIHSLTELYEGYKILRLLTEIGTLIKSKAHVVLYDAYILPLMIKSFKNGGNISSQGTNDLIENILKSHIRSMGDYELEQTALVFFDNNLNLTETANALFIHRNTLIYRLNKIESITGYDIRKFNDAINYYLSYLAEKII